VGRSAPQLLDPVLPGRLAELLADRADGGLTAALDLLREALDLRAVVLHDATGTPAAAAGEPVQSGPATPIATGPDPVHLPLRAAGQDLGTLTVVGARPEQLPMLTASVAVLALALSRTGPAPADGTAAELLAAADGDADEVADLLHDGPVQALVVARYAADAAARGGDPTMARDAVQVALVELRRALWHLRPRAGSLTAVLGMLSARLEEAGRPPLRFMLDESTVAVLPAAVTSTAYRLVQAVALPADAPAARVALRRGGPGVLLDVDGGTALAAPQRWAAKARALGGSLTCSPDHIRLALPLTLPVSKPPFSPRPKATP
jgi:hypothetical protein